MIQELLYTSAPRGLKPGSRGFCTVMSSRGLSGPLATALESLSGYRQIFTPDDPNASLNPVSWMHLTAALGGKTYSILSRVSDYGLDYSQRTNKLAHHMLLEGSDLVPAGPAWVLSQPGFMIREWKGEPRLLSEVRRIPPGEQATVPCRKWGEMTGDPAWAGVLAECAMSDPVRPAILLFKPGQDLLPLMQEALSLLPPERRWKATFCTYFTNLPQTVNCAWRCIPADSPEAHQSRRMVNALRIDLTKPLGPAPENRFANQARTGQKPAAPKRPTVQPGGTRPGTNPQAAGANEGLADLPGFEDLPPDLGAVALPQSHSSISTVRSEYSIRPPVIPDDDELSDSGAYEELEESGEFRSAPRSAARKVLIILTVVLLFGVSVTGAFFLVPFMLQGIHLPRVMLAQNEISSEEAKTDSKEEPKGDTKEIPAEEISSQTKEKDSTEPKTVAGGAEKEEPKPMGEGGQEKAAPIPTVDKEKVSNDGAQSKKGVEQAANGVDAKQASMDVIKTEGEALSIKSEPHTDKESQTPKEEKKEQPQSKSGENPPETKSPNEDEKMPPESEDEKTAKDQTNGEPEEISNHSLPGLEEIKPSDRVQNQKEYESVVPILRHEEMLHLQEVSQAEKDIAESIRYDIINSKSDKFGFQEFDRTMQLRLFIPKTQTAWSLLEIKQVNADVNEMPKWQVVCETPNKMQVHFATIVPKAGTSHYVIGINMPPKKLDGYVNVQAINGEWTEFRDQIFKNSVLNFKDVFGKECWVFVGNRKVDRGSPHYWTSKEKSSSIEFVYRFNPVPEKDVLFRLANIRFHDDEQFLQPPERIPVQKISLGKELSWRLSEIIPPKLDRPSRQVEVRISCQRVRNNCEILLSFYSAQPKDQTESSAGFDTLKYLNCDLGVYEELQASDDERVRLYVEQRLIGILREQ